jgi:hypothetical protein
LPKTCLAQENEEAKIKTELDHYLKNLEEYIALKSEVDKLKIELESLENHRFKLLQMFDSLADVNDSKTPQIDSLIRLKHYYSKKMRPIRDKVIFRVQIAAYKKHPLDEFAGKSAFLWIDNSDINQKRYLLGNFRGYHEAKQWSDFLNENGAESYVVAYKRGKRLKSLSIYTN